MHKSTMSCSFNALNNALNNALYTSLPLFVASEFCPAETAVVNGIEYLWPNTSAGTNANFTCPNNPRFSVTRNCSVSGNWQNFDQQGCGILTDQLRTILSSLLSSVCRGVLICVCA